MHEQFNNAVKITLIVFALLGAIWFFSNILWVVRLVMISLLVVYTLYPLINLLERNDRIPHGVAVTLVFFSFIVGSLLLLFLIVPIIEVQIQELSAILPDYLQRTENYMAALMRAFTRLRLEDIINRIQPFFPQAISQIVEQLTELSINLVKGVVDLFFILFLVFYLLYDLTAVKSGVVLMLPPPARDRARQIVALVDETIGFYIRGLLGRSLLVGVLTFIGLLIIGMPFALLLAFVAALLNMVLYIGPYIAAIPAILLSFGPGTPLPIVVIALYLIVQLIDGFVFAPFLLGRAVNLKPITIIVAILIGSQLGGLLGMVVSVPIAGMIKRIVQLVVVDKYACL